MTSVRRYLDEVKIRFVSQSCIILIAVIAERAIQDRGYFRARMVLTNGDFLEITEWQGQVIQEAGLRDFCASRTAPDVYLQRGTYGSHYADYQHVLWDHNLPLLL